MEIFDLGIAWNWEPDTSFIKELNDCALKEGLKPYLIHAYNFYSTLKDIAENHIYFPLFLDCTVNDGTPLCEVGDFLKKRSTIFINYPDRIKKLTNRHKIYLEPISYNVSIPMRILLKPQDSRHILELKIKYLSNPFVLKFVENLSGVAINIDARSVDDILRLKEQYGNITYIAQEKIEPIILDNRRASFRNIYCLGDVIPSWWHPTDNVYEILARNDIDKFKLDRLLSISKEIAHSSRLDFFLTEIVMDKKGDFLVTDQINVHPDMRRKSKFNDGIPDEIVDRVIKSIICFVKQKTRYDK
jgi:hypothetical protein